MRGQDVSGCRSQGVRRDEGQGVRSGCKVRVYRQVVIYECVALEFLVVADTRSFLLIY